MAAEFIEDFSENEMDSMQETATQRSSVIETLSVRDERERESERMEREREKLHRRARIVNYDDCLGTVRVESVIRLYSLSKNLGDNVKRLLTWSTNVSMAYFLSLLPSSMLVSREKFQQSPVVLVSPFVRVTEDDND